MKFTAVNESLSYQFSNVLFQRKIIGLIAKQENEKSTQIYKGKIWIRSLRITATMGKECFKGLQVHKQQQIHIKMHK